MFGRTRAGPLQVSDLQEERRDGFNGDDMPHIANVLVDDFTSALEFKIPNDPDDRLVSINDPTSFGAELLRTLAMRLRLAQKRHPIKKLVVTSAVPGEGKTLLAANLAITLALHMKRVLLIDGDLRSASLSRRFDIVDETFVSTWREDGAHRLPLRRKAEGLPLWVVPAGKPAELPGNILQSAEFSDALATSEGEFDWIILDSPPWIPFGDAGILASLSDAVILVTRRGVTPRNVLRTALMTIDKSKIIATVLNCANVATHRYYRSYYAHVHGALPAPGSAAVEHPQILKPK